MLSTDFEKFFSSTYTESLKEDSYALYHLYAARFSSFIDKDFLLYEYSDSAAYVEHLFKGIEDGKYKPKTVYNMINILSRIAKDLELAMGIEDNFSNQPKPHFEYTQLGQADFPSIDDVERILNAASNYTTYSDFFYAAIYLICSYALSRAEIFNLCTDNVFEENGRICIKRKEYKVNQYLFPTIIQLDSYSDSLIRPFYNNMLSRRNTDTKSKAYLFVDRHEKPFTKNNFSYHWGKIAECSGLSRHYTIRDFRCGAMIRVAKSGGRNALSNTVGVRSTWGDRYVDASFLAGDESVLFNAPTSAHNYVILPKDEISLLFKKLHKAAAPLKNTEISLALKNGFLHGEVKKFDSTGSGKVIMVIENREQKQI